MAAGAIPAASKSCVINSFNCLRLQWTRVGFPPDILSRALDHYQQTEYVESLHVLNPLLNKDSADRAAVYLLAGKNHFRLGDQKKAIEFFEITRRQRAPPGVESVQAHPVGRQRGRR